MTVGGEELDRASFTRAFADLGIAEVREHGREARRRSYPDAGHFACFPYALPSMPPLIQLAPGPGITMDFGGAPAANAAARQSWSQILAFLADAV